MQPTPRRIGRYEVVDRIGQGGMGFLYLARDPLLDRPLAIKVLSSDDEELRERFAREARSAAALKHPNIVTLYDVGSDEGRPFIAMEYIDGETMGEAIRRRAPMPLSRKLQLLMELCDGLGYAHRRGIIHRDIKPANLMITADGVLKILDFGIARIANSEVATGLTRTGMMMGTVHYMSPEQIEGARVDQRSDIFAVGLVCYELISNRKAYGGATHEVLYKIMHRQPEPLADLCPGLDEDLYAGIDKAISKSPDDRYQSLETFGEDLRRIRERLDVTNEAPTFIEQRRSRADGDTGRGHDSGPVSGTPAHVPRLHDIAKRRQTQIDTHVRQAQQHYAAGAFDEAIEQCEQAAQLDPQDTRVIALLERSHAAAGDRQAQNQVADATTRLADDRLDEAEALINQALELRPALTQAIALQRKVQERRRELERAAEVARAIQDAVDRARTQFDAGAFEAARRAAGEALAIDASHAEALTIKTRADRAIEELERREQEKLRREEEERQRQEEDRQRREREERQRQEEEERRRREAEERERLEKDRQRREAEERREEAARQRENELKLASLSDTEPFVIPAEIPAAPRPAPASASQETRLTRPRMLLAAIAVLAVIGAGIWLIPDRPDPPPGSDAQALLDDASRLFDSGERQRALALATSLTTQPDAAERAGRLLASFRNTAASETTKAREAAVSAGASARDLGQADQVRDRAVAAANTAEAVGLYAEAGATYSRLAARGAGPDQLVALASAALSSGDRTQAIELAAKALGQSRGFAPALQLLQSIVSQARGRASEARRAAIGARVENDPNFGAAAKQMAAAERLAPPDAARAVTLLEDAERLYRTAAASAVSIDELLRQAEASRRTGNAGRAIDLVLQIQTRDQAHAGARALLSGLLADASGAATTARTAAMNANAGATPAFQRAEARLIDAKKSADPRQQFTAFSDATVGFGEAVKTAPVPAPPPPAPPPSDPTVRARSLLSDAETALKNGALDDAERLLQEMDAELKARGASLAAADEARRAGVANGVRTARNEAATRADRAGIQAALREYEAAYEARQVDRLMRVAPFLNRQILVATFKEVSKLTMELTVQQPVIEGSRAFVGYEQRITQVTNVAGTITNGTKGQFILVKDSTGSWSITGQK